MKHSLLLFLSANHLHAQHMVGGDIAAQHAFVDNPEGHDQFTAFLKTLKCTTYLLTDLIEEDFRHEIVPHLRGGNRTALLQRKFDQFYRATPFHQVTLLYRQKTGRRDDDMLFSALTNPALINSWLNIMMAQQTPLAGIYSVPQISAPLIKNHPSNHLLLVSWEKYSGLRQTFFSNHHLHVSRLTPVHAELTFHDAVLRELVRTFQYLKSLSLLPAGQILDVLILCNTHDRIKLQDRLPANSGMKYDFADIAEVGKQLKVKYRFSDSDASQIFLHQLVTHPPKTSYASEKHVHFYQLLHLRDLLNVISVLLFLVMLLWGANNFWLSSSASKETEEMEAQATRTLGEVKQITSGFPNTYAPAADMKAGVTAMRKLDQYAPAPQSILEPISKVLDRHPRIQLDELSWYMDAKVPVDAGSVSDVPAVVVILKGTMLDFANDYRSALNYLDSFETDFKNQGYKVTILTRPFDASSTGSIADQRELKKDLLEFSVKISYRSAKPSADNMNRPPS